MHQTLKKSRKKGWLWITDPWNTLDHQNDTSLRILQVAHNQGVPQYWADVRSVRLENQRILVSAFCYEKTKNGVFIFGKKKNFSPNVFDQIHYRTDPPVDAHYLHPLHLLSLALNTQEQMQNVVNPLPILQNTNEKLEAFRLRFDFSRIVPKMVVSSQLEPLIDFLQKEKKAILKPLANAQSKGIQEISLSRGLRGLRHDLFDATLGHTQPILLQEYLPEIKKGEHRVWFVDGKFIGAVRKFPVSGDFRVDIDRGSRIEPPFLNSKQKQVIEILGRHIKKRKIRLAALDLIGTQVTDFNVTSPALIPQMERVLGENLAEKIVSSLLQQSQRRLIHKK